MTERLPRILDTGNVLRFLISFICAFALWAWVESDRDPEQTYRASQVPIVALTPDGLDLVGSLGTANVTLEGPRSVIQTIDASSISAVVDLRNVDEPGTYSRRVRVEAPDGLRKAEADPDEVTVVLDAVVSQTFDVELLTPENVPRNLAVTSTSVDPLQVTVTGVEQNVSRVARVIVPVELGEQTITYTSETTPIAVDENGQAIDTVRIEPDQVSLTVELEVRGKEVAVYVQCQCDAAAGHEVVGQPIALPNTVVVDGPRELLDEVQFVYTVPIDTGALDQSTVLEDIPLDTAKLPDGIVVERDFVDVSVRVEQKTFTRSFDEIPVEILNAPRGVRVTVAPEFLSIQVEGPQQVIESLASSDIAVVVDVTGLGEGTHPVTPRLILPPQVSYSDPPPQVIVTIVNRTPTPTPGPSPEPTATSPP